MMRLPRLGRPIYVTLGLAIGILVVTYGGMEAWSRIETYWRMRALDRRWHDTSLSVAARAKAAQMLAEFGSEAAPYLLAAAQDADNRVREKACSYLGGLEPLPEEAVIICLTALKQDSEPRVRASAAESLGSVAYAARRGRLDRRQQIIESLVAAGRDESPIVRHAVVRAMIGADANNVDPSPWLEDSDRSVRLAAAEAMLWLNPANQRRMVPMLQAMILQASPERPGDMIRPLGLLFRVEPSACRSLVPTFVSWLNHEDADIRIRIVDWLALMGPIARDAIPALEAQLNHGRPTNRVHAAFAIIIIDPSACERATADLLALLRDVGIHPRERIQALNPLNAMFHQPGVPGRVRDNAMKDIRTIPDQPGNHPEFVLRVRQFLEAQESDRSRPRAIPTARRPARNFSIQ
jgi:HEAT repeat protein